ncbi:MAG: hypothetical protein AAF514_09990, partial [Verrucomicrobiota bacterium]
FDELTANTDPKLLGQWLAPRLIGDFEEKWHWMRARPDAFNLDAQANVLFNRASDLPNSDETRQAFSEASSDLPTGKRNLKLEQALQMLVHFQSALTDPEPLRQWIDSMDHPQLQSAGLKAGAEAFLRVGDAAEAAPFVAAMSPGPTRDEFAARVAGEITHDPRLALQWARSIEDEAQRETAVRNVSNLFSVQDFHLALKQLEDES